ncbi:MAG TPA: patatin-like phospholipase family protein [Thermoleophilaceae bacterium]|nr:patatin-like phospholipase family protein [Thermoleophilaceae bacterium]
MARFRKPDVLVLGGGGILGEAWMTAVLVGLEEATGFDARECEGYVGTSAGSIVAAVLSAGVDPRTRLGRMPEQPGVEEVESVPETGTASRAARRAVMVGRGAAAPLVAAGLQSVAPGGAFFRRTLLGVVPRGRRSLSGLGDHLERDGARWDDGRLRVSAVDVKSGRRVMFGAPGAPEASVGQAVEASCAIPGVFEPVRIGGREYVDGGAWSPTNLDAAPVTNGSRVLCLNPTGAFASPLLAGIGLVSRSTAALEAIALQRQGARVRTIVPDEASVAVIGRNLMDPRPRKAAVEAGLAQGRAVGRGA